MISHELDRCEAFARMLAEKRNQEFVTVEHLLLAILENDGVKELIKACNGNVEQLQSELTQFIDECCPAYPDGMTRPPETTDTYKRILQRAIMHGRHSQQKEISCEQVLAAMYSENESHAVHFLHAQNIRRYDVLRFISHGIRKRSGDEQGMADEFSAKDGRDSDAETTALARFATNLNERAQDDKIDPLIGRQSEVKRTVQVLCRRNKNNPLFVGDAGVGKTAIAEGIAKRIVDREIPEILLDCTIYSLDMGRLVAGTQYRGDFEQRLKDVVGELKDEPGAILFIDEIHTVIGAGSTRGSVMDASDMLKPLLVSGEVRCIGSTTYEEYRQIFEKDHALTRRFQKIDIAEPSNEDCIAILRGLKTRFERHHKVRFTAPAIRAAVELAARYISDRKLPDKAIDVIDEAGARIQLQPANKRKRTVGVKEIETIVSGMARVPPRTVATQDVAALKSLDRDLKLVVFGQDEAIDAVSSAIRLSRSGLSNPDRPIASILFTGPTGVGKTEVSRQLADTLGIELVRFDMSEYMEQHSVSRLIGSPPGYVGYHQGGQLTEAITKSPHAVLLFDEIEKAHPDVFNVLLQVMDYGTLTDNAGRKADFRNVVIIMTTNAGAVEMARASIGFTHQDHSQDSDKAVEKTFAPEFRNRLDSIIHFKALDEETILSVVDKFLIDLEHQLEDKNVALEVDLKARKWIASEGFDSAMGARPMARVINEHIKKQIAEELLFGELTDGGTLKVGVKSGRLSLRIVSSKSRVKS